MSSTNEMHTFGDNNILFQDVNARDINIITGHEENLEIREEKKIVAEHLALSFNLLSKLQGRKLNSEEEKEDIDESEFDGINWDDLLEAIEIGNCVLFIGQDISSDGEGNSIHESFYKSISQRKIEYDEKDGFFMPGADKQIETKALSFYGKKFQKNNLETNEVLTKLAEIPFSLIVPVCPDDSMHQIFKKFNKKHSFLFYKPKEKQKIETPTVEKPVIYNLLGNAASDGKYIYTHEQFYNYINEDQESKLPLEIENKIKNVPLYLFIGIDFNRWYNRLLLFTLNLYQNSEAYTFNSKKINEYTQIFIGKQFNILDIESKYNNFVTVLLKKTKRLGIGLSLFDTFIENTKNDLIQIKDDAKKSTSYIELANITERIESIHEMIGKLL